MLGMSMVVEKVSVDRVKARLAGLKRKRNPIEQHKQIIEKVYEKKKTKEESSEEEDDFAAINKNLQSKR